jgi:hypothetical protein
MAYTVYRYPSMETANSHNDLLLEARKVFLPLQGQEVFLPVITPLTGWNEIVLRTLAPPNQGYHMIHRQVWRPDPGSAVITCSLGTFISPPPGPPEISRLRFFPLNFLIGRNGEEMECLSHTLCGAATSPDKKPADRTQRHHALSLEGHAQRQQSQ